MPNAIKKAIVLADSTVMLVLVKASQTIAIWIVVEISPTRPKRAPVMASCFSLLYVASCCSITLKLAIFLIVPRVFLPAQARLSLRLDYVKKMTSQLYKSPTVLC